MFIYLITNLINNKQYVGLTTNSIEIRWKKHCRQGNLLFSSIKKYGKENFSIQQLDSAESIEELNSKEIYWIEKLNCIVPNGYNLKLGGLQGGKCTEEVKAKISNSQKGKKHTDEWKLQARQRNLGNNNPRYGKPVSEDTKRKISEAKRKTLVIEV